VCFIIHTDTYEGNPYGEHTLASFVSANQIVKEILNTLIEHLFTDKDYKEHGDTNHTIVLIKSTANKNNHKHLNEKLP